MHMLCVYLPKYIIGISALSYHRQPKLAATENSVEEPVPWDGLLSTWKSVCLSKLQAKG